MELRDVKAVRSLEETENRYWKANGTLPSPIPFFFLNLYIDWFPLLFNPYT